MSNMLHLAICFAFVRAQRIESCPTIECKEREFAIDSDDWCVRVNFDEVDSLQQSTVKIRKCLGPQKQYCEWGLPDFHQKFAWPFSPKGLVGETKEELFGSKQVLEAKCVDANRLYHRTKLHAGWPCLLDLDCHSKKCWRGRCAGRLLDDSCNQDIDCVSGLFCDVKQAPGKCVPMRKQAETCDSTEQCLPGKFCRDGRCEEYFRIERGEFARDPRQCKTGSLQELFVGDIGPRCREIGYVVYGPYFNRQTNRKVYFEMDGQDPIKCRSDGFKYTNDKVCARMEGYIKQNWDNFEVTTFESPFLDPMFLLTG